MLPFLALRDFRDRLPQRPQPDAGVEQLGECLLNRRSVWNAALTYADIEMAYEQWMEYCRDLFMDDPHVGGDTWTIPTQPQPMAHFATYPEKLVEPCILAGCPREVCRVCGKPRERVVERSKTFQSGSGRSGNTIAGKNGDKCQGGGDTGDIRKGPCVESTTIGWTDCGHGDYRPGIVCDIFGGSGTTGIVAAKLNRDYILIELNEEYAETIARPRLAHVETGVTVAEQRSGQMGLFA